MKGSPEELNFLKNPALMAQDISQWSKKAVHVHCSDTKTKQTKKTAWEDKRTHSVLKTHLGSTTQQKRPLKDLRKAFLYPSNPHLSLPEFG